MIVVFGSVGVDLVTRVARFPRPGETLACDGYDIVAGTKGANQALAARRAGSAVTHVATRGNDPFGAVAVALLKEAGVDLSSVAISGAPTGACMVTLSASGENAIIAAAGANNETAAASLAHVSFGAGDTLVLQREIRDRETFAAIRLGHARGARVVLNVAPAYLVPPELLGLIDILVLNETETLVVGEGLGIASGDPEDVGRQLAAAHGRTVVVTLGGAGAVVWSGDLHLRAPALSIAVVDTTAAGDSFIGYMVAALDQGADLETALRRATVAGSLCCARYGAQTGIPTAAEVDAALHASVA